MTEKRFTLAYSDYDWWAICDKENPTKRGISDNDVVDLLNQLNEENEQLKQSIKEIDDSELHLKQIILKRIDDYIWEWEDEGTPVAQVLKELKRDIE